MKTTIKLLTAACTLFLALPQNASAQTSCEEQLVTDLQYCLTSAGTQLNVTVTSGTAILSGTIDYSQTDLAGQCIDAYNTNTSSCLNAYPLVFGSIEVLNNDQAHQEDYINATYGGTTTNARFIPGNTSSK